MARRIPKADFHKFINRKAVNAYIADMARFNLQVSFRTIGRYIYAWVEDQSTQWG